MRISRFTNRVKISKKEKIRTSTGATADSLVEVITCRGGIENTSVSSYLSADKETAVSSFKILIRKPNVDIKVDYVVEDLDTNRIFEVIFPPKYLEKNTVLELSCEETE